MSRRVRRHARQAQDSEHIAALQQIRGPQNGLAVGGLDDAQELHGVQIGLINGARNNKPPFRWVPILNLRV